MTPTAPSSRDTMFVVPLNPSQPVRRPDTRKHLAAEGEVVPRDAFWLRRIADRDVEEREPAAAVPDTSSRRKARGEE